MEELTGIRKKVFLDRYSLKDKEGVATEQDPRVMWKRVARGIAQVEKKGDQKKWEKAFYNILSDFKFVPGGRILSGAGTNYQVTYFNCFVIPSPKDSREGILDSLKQLVEIQSRSGGVGLNLSSLRPKGARVKKVNGTSSGPVTWAGLFSYATHDVVQQGGTRRGATMLMLWDWHPDIEEFITVKQDLSKINGANLSVCISDSFMEAVKKDGDWDLVYPDITDPRYDELWDGDLETWKKNGGKVKVHKTIKAKYLWDLICEAAWRSAEPGLHFLERSNKRSNTWYFEKLIATNPCGEQPLGAWAVCNLGAMNLAEYVRGGKFDFKNFGKDVKVAMRFLDNVIDETYYFFEQNEKIAKEIRRTGLGIMGLADALIKMELRYGSKESLPVIRKIFETLRNNAYEASSDTAAEKGAFPKFDAKKYLQGYHIKALPKELREKIKKQGIRNAVLLTIAPTGTTSLLAGVSSGVEPVYEFSFTRRDRTGEHEILHPLYEEWKKQNPTGTKPAYFCSANDLTPMEHAEVQAVAQEYIDSSISKTVNAPNEHLVEDVKTLYMAAYDLGLKGVTYMRDGSRVGVLERKKEEPKKEEVAITNGNSNLIQMPIVKDRPMVVHGSTYRIQTPVGTAFITINTNGSGEPLEVFINVGKAGSDVYAMATGLGRVISLALRFSSHLPTDQRVKELIDQLCDIGGARTMGFGKERVRSLPDAIAKVLEMHYTLNNQQDTVKEVKTVMTTTQEALPLHATASDAPMTNGAKPKKKSNFDICPKCGEAAFVYEEGCKKCYSCAYSEC
ncbi:MAG TPA: adenosylcobalamin-dependent ribonucleoside-diphosphate reductase [Candidatus Nitrosocosmicus sp.]|nr:adenosylcobalamin-dependent ribonucleoside-diphosphate reductase [Candidatus Nitrosocosmicus sp.]